MPNLQRTFTLEIFFRIYSKLTRSSTYYYQSIHQVSRLWLQQFLRYFADRVKCPKLQRAITHEVFFRIYSKVNQITYLSLPIYSSSFKALALIVFEIFCSQGQYLALQRVITHELFFRIYSKVNQIIKLSLSINSPSFKALAPTVFVIFC